MFSRPTQHALRALAFLAQQPPGRLAGAQEIAASGRIPPPFLWKILRTLVCKKLLRSFKGMRGGYELARPARRITLENVLRVMGEKEASRRCLLGLPRCRPDKPCPLHPARDRLDVALRRCTLSDIADVLASASAMKRPLIGSARPVRRLTRR